jgi:pyridine nucleotide-disulfide oxidoreductase domain-containing protein 1
MSNFAVQKEVLTFHRINKDDLLIKDTAIMLNEEWPKISLESRIKWLSQSSMNKLPASWVLLKHGEPIAHVRLSTKYKEDQTVNVSVIATSVVVAKEYRRQGIGKLLLDKMHQCCYNLGYGRVVLWTTDAVDFYVKSGYKKIQPLKKEIPGVVTKHFSSKTLSNLHSVLMKKRKNIVSHNNNNADTDDGTEQVEIVDGSADIAKNVWLAFRVRNSFKPFYRTKDSLKKEIQQLINGGYFKQQPTDMHNNETNTVYINHFPFENQIGPMCGISALNCVKEYFDAEKSKNINVDNSIICKIITKIKNGNNNDNNILKTYECKNDSIATLQPMLQENCILEEAITAKLTTDGEMFDIKKLGALASMDACHLNSVIIENMSLKVILSLLLQRLPILICYDRSTSSSIYGVTMKKGKAAHWGVIVGFIDTVNKIKHGNKNETKYKYIWLDEADKMQDFDRVDIDKINVDPILILQHTMSSQVLLCRWSVLKISNLQIEEYITSLDKDHCRRYKTLGWKSTSNPTLKNCILFCYPKPISSILENKQKKWLNVLDAYCKTHYYIDVMPVADGNSNMERINVMVNRGVPVKLLNWLYENTDSYSTEWFIATAFNPFSKPCDMAYNLHQNGILENYIIKKEWLYLKGIGQDPKLEWPGEHHFLICANYNCALDVMKRFHQNAVVISSSSILSKDNSFNNSNVNEKKVYQRPPKIFAKLLFNDGYLYPSNDADRQLIISCDENGGIGCSKGTNANIMRKRRSRVRHKPLFKNRTPTKIVLIGGGVASISCIEAILDMTNLKSANDIVEPFEIYLITPSQNIQRLKKKRKLTSHLREYEIEYENVEALAKKGVRVIQDTVVGLQVEKKHILLESGSKVIFDKLFIGSGAAPKLLFPSPFCLGIRDKTSVINLVKCVSVSKHIIIVGNGAIALETIEALSNFAVDITWVLRHNYVGNTFFDHSASAFFQSKLWQTRTNLGSNTYEVVSNLVKHLQWQVINNKQNDGIPTEKDNDDKYSIHNVVLGHSLGPSWLKTLNCNIDCDNEDKNMKGSQFSPHLNIVYNATIAKYADSSKDNRNGWNLHVCLSNGIIYGCDFVISATGVVPNTQFLKKNNENIYFTNDGGIPVKRETMQTFFSKDIYAGGDCSTVQVASDNEIDGNWFQMRLWDQAMFMGQKAAISLMSVEKMYYDSLNFELFTHVSEVFGYKVVLLGRYNGQGMSRQYAHALESISLRNLYPTQKFKLAGASVNNSDFQILLRCTPSHEYIKVVVVKGRVCGCILIGETDLEETFENLILSQINVQDIDLLDPDVDLEDFFD